MDTRVSVIIPTYNRMSTLPRAVNSVLNQSYQEFDLWILDDGSSDDTQTWVKTHLLPNYPPNKVHYIRWEQNLGVSSARNRGAELSKGEWLAFLDSDDEWLPDKLEKQMALAESSPDTPLIHGEEIWVRRGVRVNPKKKHKKSGGRIFLNSLDLCCISPSTTVLRRGIFDELGPFNESFPVCEDYELWLKITSCHSVGFVTDPVIVKYGGHADQLSHRYVAMDYWRVKALAEFLNHPGLTMEEKNRTKEVLMSKAQILLKGYEKHNNLKHHHEVSTLLKQAQSLA